MLTTKNVIHFIQHQYKQIHTNTYIYKMENMADLMNGLVRARSVRMNQEGWTIIKDFKFLRNLSFDQENES